MYIMNQFIFLCVYGTNRAELRVKESELDAVSDRLAEEQRQVRELQWEVERERSRADRRAEGEREELEVRDITVIKLSYSINAYNIESEEGTTVNR